MLRRGYKHDPNNPNSLSGDGPVQAIYEDQAGRLWIGTRDGLNRFDPTTETFTRYVHDPDDPGSLSDNEVRASAPTLDGPAKRVR